jgi:hypothetical protein
MKVVFCYALPTVVQGFVANETLRRARIPWWWRRLITVRMLMWPPNAKLPWSAPAVLNGHCRARLNMRSFFVTPYRRSCKGLAPTKHFISGQPHFGHNCFWGWGCNCLGLFFLWL